MADETDIIRAGAELVVPSTGEWLRAVDITGPLIVLVHGFTSHGRYLRKLGAYLHGPRFITAIFNYDSYLGIDRAADELADRLQFLSPSLQQHGFAVIGHSMGGLVARRFSRFAAAGATSALRGIGLLGTPNAGTLDRRVVSYMLDWAGRISSPNPYYRSAASRASQQLTLSDPSRLIATLNELDRATPPNLPVLSVSGGHAYLELGEASRFAIADQWKNRGLQALIGETPNDGLVAESSADFGAVIDCGLPSVRHCNDYLSYRRINHTYLTQSQEVANVLISWLNRQVFP
jgi:pimeloyl-ACP methyl ester carboxylesterase